MDDTELAYLAGVLDSDGYFSVRRSTYHMRVTGDARQPMYQERIGIKQVSPVAVEMLKARFGGHMQRHKPSTRNGKWLHGWTATDRIAATVALTLLPYLRIKREQAELLLILRSYKDKPLKQPETMNIVCRWGYAVPTRRWVWTPEESTRRETLWLRCRELNDVHPQPARLVG